MELNSQPTNQPGDETYTQTDRQRKRRKTKPKRKKKKKKRKHILKINIMWVEIEEEERGRQGDQQLVSCVRSKHAYMRVYVQCVTLDSASFVFVILK